jgi:hypothetical protein
MQRYTAAYMSLISNALVILARHNTSHDPNGRDDESPEQYRMIAHDSLLDPVPPSVSSCTARGLKRQSAVSRSASMAIIHTALW